MATRDTIREAVDWVGRRNPLTVSRHVLLWLALGLVCGLFAVAYWLLVEWLMAKAALVQGPAVVALMGAAGLLIGILTDRLGDPGEIATMVDNIHLRGGRFDTSRNGSMLLTALLSIGAGGSLGPESPLVQVTGSLGTWLADRLKVSGEQLRCLSLAGMAAGFTALFGAPLGGALFALEILHHEHVVEYYEAILPAIVCSCASYLVFAAITHLGFGPTWRFPQHQAGDAADYGAAIACALVGAAVGWLFVHLVRAGAALFGRLPGGCWVRTTIAGILLGLLAWAAPLTRFFGHDQLDLMLRAELFPATLLLLAGAKLLAIVVTGTGHWRGGFIIPLFFVGATLGRMLSLLIPALNPTLAMVAVMAALNASVTRTPVSTTVLLAKLTGSTVTPVLFASLTGYYLAPKAPLIESQAASREEEDSAPGEPNAAAREQP